MPNKPVIALLGGGQLGRMFIENALRYDVPTHILDPAANAPCANIATRFAQGAFSDHDTVVQFAQQADVISIEIEHVSVSALEELEANGKTVVPSPGVLRTIQDKGSQKQFYVDHNIPTSGFELVEDRDRLVELVNKAPRFLKARTGGYDGKGVMALRSVADAERAFDGPWVVEEMVGVEKELAVIAVRGLDGSTTTFPVTEMVFDPQLDLVDYLIAPAEIEDSIAKEARQLALRVIDAFGSPGIFAIEMFLTKSGDLLVNEVAPRAHNSGHHTIEACASSQYDQLLRVLMGWPLGDTSARSMAAMVNLIGEGGNGPVEYAGLDEVLKIPGAFVHTYGKAETRTGRKMGHVTLLGKDRAELEQKIERVKELLHIRPQLNEKAEA